MSTYLLQKEVILEIVDAQIRSKRPPESHETYDRLVHLGYSDEEARDLIGVVVSGEVISVMKMNKSFDSTRYISALKKLPTLPT